MSFCGRSLSASGRGASWWRPAAANRVGPLLRFARVAIMAALVSSAEHGGNLLAAALDGDAPDPGANFGDALQVRRLGNLGVVDRHHDVALLEAELLGQRAAADFGHDHAL